MSRHLSLLLLLLLFLPAAILAFENNQTITATTVATDEHKVTPQTKIGDDIYNTIQKKIQEKLHRRPVSNGLNHLLGYSGVDTQLNSTYITRGKKTCQKIHCTTNHYVRSCDVDGGNDTCVRCAEGTYLPDNTSSIQYNHECLSIPECWPEATKSLIPNICAGEHRTFCKCDLTRNFCGHDPCKCKVGDCPFSAPVLRPNCGCDRLLTTTTPTNTMAPTTKTIATTAAAATKNDEKTIKTTTKYSNPQTTEEKTPPTTSRQSTVPLQTEDSGLPGGYIAAIVLLAVLLAIAIVIIVFLLNRRQNTTGNILTPVPADDPDDPAEDNTACDTMAMDPVS